MKSSDPDLRPGQSVELLKELHILTRDGRMNQDSRRKLKQVYHLFQFIEKLLLEVHPTPSGPTLADHGAGKSYLGFILYDLFFKQRQGGHIFGIETRAELVERSRALAHRLGFERMSFLNLSAADAAQAAGLPCATLRVRWQDNAASSRETCVLRCILRRCSFLHSHRSAAAARSSLVGARLRSDLTAGLQPPWVVGAAI